MKKYKRIVSIVPLDQRRFKVLYIIGLLIIISLFGRLVNLQVFNAAVLQQKQFVRAWIHIHSLAAPERILIDD